MLISYRLMNPTGNITALVETDTPVSKQPCVAMKIMQAEPTCEQVGFVSHAGKNDEYDIELRMAAGEFCGNATMSTAALWAYDNLPIGQTGRNVVVKASGTSGLVDVYITRTGDEMFSGKVKMPLPKKISERTFTYGSDNFETGMVEFEGITHLVLNGVTMKKSEAEEVIQKWCDELGVEGLGIMFLEGDKLSPLVYVPSINSLFWESSCASGTTAVGAYLHYKNKAGLKRTFSEPGGQLCISADDNMLVLEGRVLMGSSKMIDISEL